MTAPTPAPAPAPGPRVARHPVRGGFAGLALGAGLAFLLISFSVIALGTFTPIVVVLVGVVIGVLFGLFMPPIGPKQTT